MRIFDKLKVGDVYSGDVVRKAFPGIDSTFLINYDGSNLERIINMCNKVSTNFFVFVFKREKKFKSKKTMDYALDGQIYIALKADKFLNFDHYSDESMQMLNKDIDKLGKGVKGFYRQGTHLSQVEISSNFRLVCKKEGIKLKPNTKKHFGDILGGLSVKESSMDYLEIGHLTKGEQEFIKLVTEDIIDAAYNNKRSNREGYVGIVLKMGNLFEKATGFRLPDPFVRKFFYVYSYTSYYGDGNQVKYIQQHYIDRYKLNLILPSTGGFWVFNVVNALIMRLIDHHKRKEIYSIVLPLISRYVISGLHELADIVVTDALFSKDEIEKLKNYFVRRKLKPETDKHFGDILTSL